MGQIRDIVVWLFRLAGREEDEDLLDSCSREVRAIIDEDENGDISMEELVKNALNSKFVASMLKTKKRMRRSQICKM